mmetsp:Transcript_16632/g.24586  ORF Transcript_16632/g.24586 Transcript_16632/m.24586 type:complete len:96 (-) Transcript_16632:551-838(-)
MQPQWFAYAQKALLQVSYNLNQDYGVLSINSKLFFIKNYSEFVEFSFSMKKANYSANILQTIHPNKHGREKSKQEVPQSSLLMLMKLIPIRGFHQ